MDNAKYMPTGNYDPIPLGSVRYDMIRANNTLKASSWGYFIPEGYVLDETDIVIPDIPKYRPTAKRVYLSGYPAHNILGYDWLGFGDPSPYGLDFLNKYMLKGDCFILDEPFISQ